MTLKSPHNTDKTVKLKFTDRLVAAWFLLLIPGLLISMVSSNWLVFFWIGPVIAAPLFILGYDAVQFLMATWKRSKKLIILPLVGLSLALLLSSIGSQIHSGRSNLNEAQALIASSNSAGNDIQGLRTSSQSLNHAKALLKSVSTFPGAGSRSANAMLPLVQEKLTAIESTLTAEEQKAQHSQAAATALENAKALAKEASEIVQDPPHPLSVWETAEQNWSQAVQYLESIPVETSVHQEAIDKLSSYQANHEAIVQRISTEENAAANYEAGRALMDELVEMTYPNA